MQAVLAAMKIAPAISALTILKNKFDRERQTTIVTLPHGVRLGSSWKTKTTPTSNYYILKNF